MNLTKDEEHLISNLSPSPKCMHGDIFSKLDIKDLSNE